MRVLYLDEAGVGNLESDPFLVVAGVLIHADTQWGPIANRLQELLEAAVPPGQPIPSHLHAKDIFHGTREFPKETWSRERRTALLKAVAQIPVEFQIPVVWCAQDRKRFAKECPGATPLEHLRDSYSTCALACLMQTEAYMRDLPNQAEVASVIMEQNHELQRRIPGLLEFMRRPDDEMGLEENWKSYLPFTRIIDTPACQPKNGSSILQLADYCAFAIKRHLQGAARSSELTGPFAQQLLILKFADDARKHSLWNPQFMPRRWGNKVEFDGSKFVMKN